MAQMQVEIAPRTGLRLKNPVIASSGTLGYGDEFARRKSLSGLGAFISKGTTLRPRTGNPPMRLWETSAGMLNAIGLQNVGVEAVVRDKAPLWATWDLPVFVNVSGATTEEYVAVVRRLDGIPGVAGVELNVSCPNVKEGGVAFGTDEVLLREVTREVRAATCLPLIVKLSPNVANIQSIACAAQGSGADAISLINTVYGLAIDAQARKPALAVASGGLSGPAIKPIALHCVYQVAQAVSIPVIGYGGIMTASDAVEFILAGASAIGIATALLANPFCWREIAGGLQAWCRREGVSRIADIVGAANSGFIGPARNDWTAGRSSGGPDR